MGANAGLRRGSVAVHDGESCPLLAFYPTFADQRPTRLGPFSIDVAADALPVEDTLPLVVLSHGSGGAPFTHRNLACHLAREGFVVVLPEHPRNNRADDTLAGTAAVLERRPREVAAAIDWVASPEGLGPLVGTDAVGIVGHSLGGYTALALAGGRPLAFAHETPERIAREVAVGPDARVAAVVLLAPATVWFRADGALDDVMVPVLMYTGDADRQAPSEHGAIVEAGLARHGRLEHHVVSGAGHYSFFSPYPPEMTSPSLPPSQDPPGFDRAAFHADLYPQVTRFLATHLPSGPMPLTRRQR